MTLNWEELKTTWDERVGVWIQCEAVSAHQAVLQGDLTPVKGAVWALVEMEAQQVPLMSVESALKRAIAHVVEAIVTGKDPFREQLENAMQNLAAIKERLEG